MAPKLAVPTPTVLNPFSRASSTGHFILSNDEQIATHSHERGWRTVRSEYAYKSGCHIIQFVVLDPNQLMVGVTTAAMERRDTHIGGAAGLGAAYYRFGGANGAATNAGVYETNNVQRRDGLAYATTGSTIRLTIDFPNETLVFLINGTHTYDVPMGPAGLLNHRLHVAFSAHDTGTSIKLIAPDPTPIILPLSRDTVERRLYNALNVIRSSPHVNILIIGPAGAGKTTFKNSCHTSLLPPHKVYVETISIARSNGVTALAAGHVTTDYTKYTPQSTNVTLWDIWGWNNGNYMQGELQSVLNGNLKAGCPMASATSRSSTTYEPLPTFEQETHGAIILIPADEARANMDTRDYWVRVDQFRAQLHAHGIQCAMIVTKCDLVDEKLRHGDSLSEIKRSPLVNTVCGQVSEKTGFPLSHIFPVKLYTSEFDRSPAVELLTLEPLACCVQQAIRYKEQKAPAPVPIPAVATPAALPTTTTMPTSHPTAVPTPVIATAAVAVAATSGSSGGMSNATAVEKAAMIDLMHWGITPSSEVLQLLRTCGGDVRTTAQRYHQYPPPPAARSPIAAV